MNTKDKFSGSGSPTSPYIQRSVVRLPNVDALSPTQQPRRTRSSNTLKMGRRLALDTATNENPNLLKLNKFMEGQDQRSVKSGIIWEELTGSKVNHEASANYFAGSADDLNSHQRAVRDIIKKKPKFIELQTPKNKGSEEPEHVPTKIQNSEFFVRPQSKKAFTTLKDKWESLQAVSIEQGLPSSEKITSSNTNRKKSKPIRLTGFNSPASPSVSNFYTFQDRIPSGAYDDSTPTPSPGVGSKGSIDSKLDLRSPKALERAGSRQESPVKSQKVLSGLLPSPPSKNVRKIIITSKAGSPIKRSMTLASSAILESTSKIPIKIVEKEPVNVVVDVAWKTRAGKLPGLSFKPNQDAFITHSNFCNSKSKYLFGVCDGHGTNGQMVSGFIKTNLPKNLEVVYKAARHNDYAHVSDIFKQGMAKTNRQLLSSYIDVHHSGTTVVSVLIFENHLWCANVGDSRAILLKLKNNHWSAVPLSFDHKPEIPAERERIIRCGGRVEQMKGYNGVPVGPQRVWFKNEDLPGLAMSRSMGDTLAEKVGKTAEADVLDLELCEEDKFIVICSDGIWEFLSNHQVMDIVKKYYQTEQLEAACTALVQKAVECWQKNEIMIDDITCVIVSLNVPPLSKED